ncbi:unnamed protein product, partial [Sphacelaria rigidula]
IFTAVPDEEQTLNEVLYEHSDDLQSPHRRVAAVGPDGIDLSTHTRGKLRGETLPGWDTGAGTSRPSRRTHNNKRRRDESKLRRQREQDEQGGDYWDRK